MNTTIARNWRHLMDSCCVLVVLVIFFVLIFFAGEDARIILRQCIFTTSRTYTVPGTFCTYENNTYAPTSKENESQERESRQ